MLAKFYENYQHQIPTSLFVLGILILIGVISTLLIKRRGRKSGINEVRISLMCRYLTVSLVVLGVLAESLVFRVSFDSLAVVFSSILAILGIAMFAVWSILSNVTSGIIMFFNFPYKIGDKVFIHDKDFPIKAIIEDIRAFQLHLRLENGDFITYPNNLMIQKAVTLIEKDAIEDSKKKKNKLQKTANQTAKNTLS